MRGAFPGADHYGVVAVFVLTIRFQLAHGANAALDLRVNGERIFAAVSAVFVLRRCSHGGGLDVVLQVGHEIFGHSVINEQRDQLRAAIGIVQQIELRARGIEQLFVARVGRQFELVLQCRVFVVQFARDARQSHQIGAHASSNDSRLDVSKLKLCQIRDLLRQKKSAIALLTPLRGLARRLIILSVSFSSCKQINF